MVLPSSEFLLSLFKEREATEITSSQSGHYFLKVYKNVKWHVLPVHVSLSSPYK